MTTSEKEEETWLAFPSAAVLGRPESILQEKRVRKQKFLHTHTRQGQQPFFAMRRKC